MLEFNTKAELLRRLGKYEKDVRLVDRMMKRGEVIYENHVYRLVPRKDVNSLIDLVMSFCGTEEEMKNKLIPKKQVKTVVSIFQLYLIFLRIVMFILHLQKVLQ